jgi:hypothetical protein
MARRRPPGTCPLCGFRVAVPPGAVGMWTGSKSEGGPAGGGVHVSRCRICRLLLVAYSDVYDDKGRILSETPALTWAPCGIPWQTISVLIVVAAAIGCFLRWAIQSIP